MEVRLNMCTTQRANTVMTNARKPGNNFFGSLIREELDFRNSSRESVPPTVKSSPVSNSGSGLSIRRSGGGSKSGGDRKLATARSKGNRNFRR